MIEPIGPIRGQWQIPISLTRLARYQAQGGAPPFWQYTTRTHHVTKDFVFTLSASLPWEDFVTKRHASVLDALLHEVQRRIYSDVALKLARDRPDPIADPGSSRTVAQAREERIRQRFAERVIWGIPPWAGFLAAAGGLAGLLTWTFV